ncbi:Glucan 1,3-beta-glucosidase [Smittium culicis]|uniref:glucan endo-1,3-beta-D-glucosidase n=1 Tax=Smittium culicis TaxID=133412 RepID=A0A1R1YJF6_9FUNG|nr:Glucan 1,3-beta-glucosidase [Smittium culicis]
MRLIFLSAILGYVSAAKIFHSLTYDQSKSVGNCNTLEQVISDISVIKKYTNIIHSSGISHCKQAEMIIKALGKDAEENLYLSVDFENDSDFNKEMEGIEELHEKYGLDNYVKAIIVGNYPISRNISNADNLISKINAVFEFLVEKGLDRINVTVSDNWDNFDRRIINSVDYIMFSSLPYRLNLHYKNATEYLFGRLKDIKNRIGSKDVVFGQIGWPTSDDAKSYKGASVENSESFMKEFVARSNKEGMDYIWYNAIDPLYMADNTGELLEERYGLLQSDRLTPKYKDFESDLLMKRSNKDEISSKSEKNKIVEKSSKSKKGSNSSILSNATNNSTKPLGAQSEVRREKTQINLNDDGENNGNEDNVGVDYEIGEEKDENEEDVDAEIGEEKDEEEEEVDDEISKENKEDEDEREEKVKKYGFEDETRNENNESEENEGEENNFVEDEISEDNNIESISEFPSIKAQQASGTLQMTNYMQYPWERIQLEGLVKTVKEKYTKNEQDPKSIKLDMGSIPLKINTSNNDVSVPQRSNPYTDPNSKYSYSDGRRAKI